MFLSGARMRDELMEGASPGAAGTVSQSGWSNGEVFQTYLETHFIKFAVGKRPILLLYDGHRSLISPQLIDWATNRTLYYMYFLPTRHISYNQWMLAVLGLSQKSTAVNVANFKEPLAGL